MNLSKKLFMLGMIGCLSAGFSTVAYADAASDRAQMYQNIIEREEANIKKYNEELPVYEAEVASIEARLKELDEEFNSLLEQNRESEYDSTEEKELNKRLIKVKSQVNTCENGITHANDAIAEAKEILGNQLDNTFISGYSREDDNTFVNAAGDKISNLTQRVALGYVDGEWRIVIPYRAWSKYGPAGGNWDYTGYAGITPNMEITLDGNYLEHDESLDTDYAYIWRVDFDITPDTVYDMTVNGRSYSVRSEFADYDGDGYKDVIRDFENGTVTQIYPGDETEDTEDTEYTEDTEGIEDTEDTEYIEDTEDAEDTEYTEGTEDTENTNAGATGTENTETADNTNTDTTTSAQVINNGLGTYLVLTGSDYITSVEDNTGVWEAQSDGKWKYKKSNGAYANNEFVKVNGAWYAFSWGSIMESDIWLRFETGTTYFCQSNGAMAADWCLIGGNWYYFNPDTSLLKGGTTPEGYAVDETGKWIQ